MFSYILLAWYTHLANYKLSKCYEKWKVFFNIFFIKFLFISGLYKYMYSKILAISCVFMKFLPTKFTKISSFIFIIFYLKSVNSSESDSKGVKKFFCLFFYNFTILYIYSLYTRDESFSKTFFYGQSFKYILYIALKNLTYLALLTYPT